jgi:hypothetical protein
MNNYAVRLLDLRVNVTLEYLIQAGSPYKAVAKAFDRACRDAGLPESAGGGTFQLLGVNVTEHDSLMVV